MKTTLTMSAAALLNTGAAALLSLSLTASAVAAPMADNGYRLPPQEITDIVLRAPSPRVSLSPDGDTMLLQIRESLPPVAELAKPMERLAGLRLNAETNGRFGYRSVIGLELRSLSEDIIRPIRLPDGADISAATWSPDGRYVSFTMTQADNISLWVLDTKTSKAKPVIKKGINAIFGAARWLPDGRLLAFTIPKDRGAKPVRSLTPTGPAIQDARGGEKAQTRTYQDLLKDPHDEAMFTWLATSQPVILDVKGRKQTLLGAPALYSSASPSPDGKYLLMRSIDPQFSYEVPYYRFAHTTEIWDYSGKRRNTIVNQPMADNLPIQGVVLGPRRITWHPVEPSLLLWAEALDGGDPKTKASHRDKLMSLGAPFGGDAQELTRLEDRYSGFEGIQDTDDVLIYDYDRDTREVRTQLLDVNDGQGVREIEVRNYQDSYNDPGDPITVRTKSGKSVAQVYEGKIFLSGRGATPKGYRPFLRSFDLQSFATKELWRNSGQSYERVSALTSDDAVSFLTYYEDPKTPGNYRHHNRGDITMVTDFTDPHPELTGIKKELITYTRDDGISLSSTLYLPADYTEGDKLPVVIWAYPLEYSDARTAGQVRSSPHRFTRIGGYSHLFFLTQGYAVMDGATMPVVGADPTTVNETFVEQIVASAQAAIDETVARGFGDGERVGVGGHSYGAFMTAHLLAGGDQFRAGIARSGAYNRTLTPFGFQSERRTFWEAPQSYFRLSPFMAADRINEPMLMTHGEADNNSGTFPQQSKRMFAAIKGNGGTTRLVMLPYESHGYRGRESVLHVLAEMIDWFDTYVKPEGAMTAE